MPAARTSKHVQLNLSERISASETVFQIGIVSDHALAGKVIAYGPQTHHYRFSSRDHECPAEPIDTFSISNVAETGTAGGQNDEFRTPKVQPRRLERSEHSVISDFGVNICSGEGKARPQKRIGWQSIFSFG